VIAAKFHYKLGSCLPKKNICPLLRLENLKKMLVLVVSLMTLAIFGEAKSFEEVAVSKVYFLRKTKADPVTASTDK
jgi:hypothetical protein